MTAAEFARRIWPIPELEMAVALPTKCGCTSIKVALSAVGDRKHLTRLLRRDDPIPLGWLKVCSARSPRERARPCWADKIMGDDPIRPELAAMGCRPRMPFEAFVAAVVRTPDGRLDRHLTPQHYLHRSPRWSGPDLLLRMETMAEDWDRLRALRPGLPDLPRLNAARARKPDWTPSTVAALAERYAEDIALLGYDPPAC